MSKWVKGGPSPNPGGRTKGLERLVRETIGDDIVAIIKAQAAIAQGKKPDGVELPPIKATDMTKAAEWLADRGWGKAKQIVAVGEASGADLDFESMSDEELDAEIAKLETTDGARGED